MAELALSANVGRAWRAPNVFELFTNGPHLGEDRYEIGKATLKAETSLNADIGVRWEHARFRGELAGFRNAVRDFIYIVPTGEVAGGLRVYRYDQADAILLGGEATAEVAAQEHLNVRGRFDYVRGSKDESGHPPLPLMPPARTALEVEWHADHLGWADKAHLGVEGEWVATQHRRTEFDFPTTGYGLVNVESGLEHALLGREFSFDLGVQNLLNKRYKNYLSRYKEFALDPGINVLFRVSTGI
jgi:iron complex outermembrane receptor protein